MKSRFSRAGLIALIASMMFLVAGSVYAAIPKNVLVIASNQSIFKTFDPHICYESPTGAFAGNLYTKLVFVNFKDGSFTVEPEIAKSWKLDADGKTWTFYLNKDHQFANGDMIDADDVVYSLQRAIKLKKSPSWLFTDELGMTVEGISKIDQYTVRVVTNGAPKNAVLTNLGGLLGSVVNRKQVEPNAKDGDMGAAWLLNHSAGAGPYVMKEWKRNERMIFLANPKFYKGTAKIKTILFKDVPEEAEQYLLIKKGDVDVVFDITSEQAKELQTAKGVKLVTTPGQSNEYVGMNAGWGPFKNPKVREAVKWAIDYDAIINKVKNGFAINNQQFISMGYFGYKTNNPYSQNLEKAKALLKEAGYADGFEVELVTNNRAARQNEAIIVQDNLAKIGIKANITVMQAAQMYGKFRKQGINMIVAGWGNDYPDAAALSNPFANHRVRQLAWRLAWLDDKAADMTEAAAKETDNVKRQAIYEELTNYWLANGPFAMLYQPITYWGVSNAVKGAEAGFGGSYVHFDLFKVSK